MGHDKKWAMNIMKIYKSIKELCKWKFYAKPFININKLYEKTL